jgi:hypothetical protein
MLNRKSILIICIFISSFAYGETPVPATISAQMKMVDRYEILVKESPEVLAELNPEQRKNLLNIVSNNDVASLAVIDLFDPPQNTQEVGEIGYCYGRAMASHLIARKMGLAQSSIKKIFAAGDMQNQTVRWRFHMSTLVLGEDTLYYAVDPIMPSLIKSYNMQNGSGIDPDAPVLPKMWIKIVKFFYDNTEKIMSDNPGLETNPDFTGTIKFYVTNTDAMMVDMREIPANLEVENGKRIIEVLFNPEQYPGFEAEYFDIEGEQELGYYHVTDTKTLDDFFMTYNEPLVEQFDFFKVDVRIFYIKDDVLSEARRHYLYNGKQPDAEDFQHFSLGYFPSLLTSIENLTESF